MSEAIFQRLTHAGVDYAVFGSAAGDVYGFARPPADLDVFVRCHSIEELAAWLPRGKRVAANGLVLGEVELWASPLVLREHPLEFDDALAARRLPHPRFGWVLSPEDQLLIKLTLRRTAGGKRDLDDAAALERRWGPRLDREYIAWRAAQLGAAS